MPYEPTVVIETLGGFCPVQAEGTVDGQPFYFRARGAHWSLGIGGEPVGAPSWHHEESYGDDPFSAGWMSEEEACGFIRKAVAFYAACLEQKNCTSLHREVSHAKA